MATLDDFCSQGWQDHAKDAPAVFARLPDGVALVTEARHLPAFASLVVHVAGEHLGRWIDGLALLERLETLPVFDAASPAAKAVFRSKAVLHRCAGDRDAEARAFAAGRSGGDVPEASDRIRVLAVAASAMVGQKRLAEASADFETCVSLATYGPTKSDPAARALAVTAHNIAVDFENQAALSAEERSLMLRSAEISRQFWLVAGGWMEAERAEYRLTMSHIKAGNAATALGHAQRCLAIVEENGSDPGEAFFAHEALAQSRLAASDTSGARAERASMATILPTITDADFRSFCAEELAKLDAKL
ncbi:MAG: hypothetical protein K8T90_13740 [Planctomycetes bacterium]|nr:hypothetical protein [Planctomycetota bacterium]